MFNNGIRRAFLNLTRSPGRTVVVVAILAVSLGLALTMFEVHQATSNQLGNISGQLGTDIEVRPAGSFGLLGSGTLLAQDTVDKLKDLAHVASVQGTLMTSYTGDNLVSSIQMGGGLFAAPTRTATAGGRFGIMVIGLDPAAASPTLMGGGQITITQGRYLNADETDADVAVFGQALADANSLQVGSVVDIQGSKVQVVGIFSSGQRFGDNMLVMPAGTVHTLFNLDGVNSVTVQADDVSNVDTIVTEIRTVFDTDTADVVTAQDAYNRISASVTNAGSSSQTGMIAAFIVAGAVILLAVLLLMRQRVREIGIFKAIGASNGWIALQFGLETLLISIVGAILGVGLSLLLSQRVADLIVNGSPATTGPRGGFGGFQRFGGGAFGGTFGGTFAGIHVVVSPEVVLVALGAALLLAVIASVVPVWYIARVKPAEVLRNE